MKRDIKQENTIRKIFSNYKRFALFGMSGNKIRPSYFVGTYLNANHFDFVSVNPNYESLFDRPCYKKLENITPPPEVVVVFRRAEETPPIARDAVKIGAKVLWLQLGIRNEEAKKIAEEAGLLFVEDRCVKVEYARYHGNLYQTGFNTGLISSKKRKSHAIDPIDLSSSCSVNNPKPPS
ncbi:CoA-binding protein [Candidatus Pacearchaeota archaeon]|nr:CoA-binding protein [Candidatus Pacearchaeota archaeon]